MNITKKTDGTKLTLILDGRLDTTTAPQLEAELKASLQGVTDLAMDFASLAYVSSAGLRVILFAVKVMKKQGKMVIRNVSESVMEVFEITGFCDLLTFE